MTGPLLPLPPGSRSATDGAAGPPRPASALVLAPTRHGPLIETAGRRWLVSGAPPLPQGAKLTLAEPVTGTRPQPARLLAIGERLLAKPVTVRLQAAGPRPSAPPPGASLPRPLPVAARLIGPTGRGLGPPLTIGLALAADPAVAAMLPAEVLRRDAQGRLLLAAHGLRLRLEAALDLPPGTRVLLALPPGLTPGDAASTDPLRLTIGLLLQREAAADTGDRPRLPAPDHALAARLLRWVHALTGGGQADEPAALGGAPSELAQQAREPQAGGWRLLAMPFGIDEPQALKLWLRPPPPEPEDERRPARERGGAPQRAVFALELSQLGACQLDVLCHDKRFDLVVRTTRPLCATIEDEIRSLVAASRAAAGLSGRLDFRHGDLLALPGPLPLAGRHLTV